MEGVLCGGGPHGGEPCEKQLPHGHGAPPHLLSPPLCLTVLFTIALQPRRVAVEAKRRQGAFLPALSTFPGSA